mmetsp:Transcript_18056/g.36747  ORF Transcript_18056/g.36747 Transcript_18056/m.36747 type:complete len:174 (+) Transcript_18056:44-565(+)
MRCHNTMSSPRFLIKSQYRYSKMLLLVAVLLANSVKAWQIAAKVTTLRHNSKLHFTSPFGGDEQEKEAMIGRYMEEKGMSKEEAETEYKAFKTNPYYSLEKGEEYYAGLGYNSLLDGVVGEAEKEGRGDEVKERIEKFKRESKLKAYGVIGFFAVSFLVLKNIYEKDPSFFGK